MSEPLISNPQPLGLILLLPAAAGVLLLGWVLGRLAVPADVRLQRWLAPALGLAAWLTAMHLLARVAPGFPTVLVAVTVTLGGLGLALGWPGLARRFAAAVSWAPR